jgi:Fe-coproporphyrin III synthase
MKAQELAYIARYGFKTLILRKKTPLIAGMPLTDVCNLQCKHCVVANTGRGNYSFAQVEKLMRGFYDRGVRILYLQGGEIMTWQEGSLTASDVIQRAKEIGFFKVAAVTNGTLGLPSEADLIWVSLDGSEIVHDSIRGAGAFARVMRTLKSAKHSRVNLNMTINRLNAAEVEKVAQIARETPNIHGVSFNFHTPYPGVEDLALSLSERYEVIDRILDLKRHHFPVLNTVAGLKAMQKNRWRRPLSIIQLVENGQIYECCWGKEQPGVCEKCGYGVIAELSQILNFNIPTIIESLGLFK